MGPFGFGQSFDRPGAQDQQTTEALVKAEGLVGEQVRQGDGPRTPRARVPRLGSKCEVCGIAA